MNKSLETMLCHLKDFAPFKEPTNSSHFPIYNTATFDLKTKMAIKYMIIQEAIILQELHLKTFCFC